MKFYIHIIALFFFCAEADYLPEDGVTYSENQARNKNSGNFNGKIIENYNLYSSFKAFSLIGTNKYVLTFDDGPNPVYTNSILRVLEENSAWHKEKFGTEVKATFFHIGNKIERHQGLSEDVIKKNHILSAHSYTHPYGNKISKNKFENELVKTHLLVDKLHDDLKIKKPITYYRFPYADYGRRSDYHHFNSLKDVSYQLYGKNCIHFAFWDIDPGDWMIGINSKTIFQNFLSLHQGGNYWRRKYKRDKPQTVNVKAHHGGVILLHSTSYKSVEALKLILEYAQNNNIEFINLDQVKEYNYGERCHSPQD